MLLRNLLLLREVLLDICLSFWPTSNEMVKLHVNIFVESNKIKHQCQSLSGQRVARYQILRNFQNGN